MSLSEESLLDLISRATDRLDEASHCDSEAKQTSSSCSSSPTWFSSAQSGNSWKVSPSSQRISLWLCRATGACAPVVHPSILPTRFSSCSQALLLFFFSPFFMHRPLSLITIATFLTLRLSSRDAIHDDRELSARRENPAAWSHAFAPWLALVHLIQNFHPGRSRSDQ